MEDATSSEILDNILDAIIESGEDSLMSGGASGGDTEWARLFYKYTHSESIYHFSYQGHKKYNHNAVGFRVILNEKCLYEGDSALKHAKNRNGRNFPCRSHNTNCLLRRNYWQVRISTSCYAVAKIEYGQVSGGTNWAVSMFIDRWMAERPYDECPCYVYDMITNCWYQWTFNRWEEIEPNEVPTPNGIWAGVGSRDLTFEAKEAMEALWQHTETDLGQKVTKVTTTPE